MAGCQTPGRAPPSPAATAAVLQHAGNTAYVTTQPAQVTPLSTPSTVPTQAPSETASPPPVPTHTSMPAPLSPTPSATATWTPTPLPPTPTPATTWTPSPVPATPTPAPTAMPPTATPPPTSAPTPTPLSPTASAYRFLPTGPAQPDPSHPCPGCPKAPAYIVGHVLDAAGNPLVGVRLVCHNEWYRSPVVASKGGGEYDFLITQADTTWYVAILDRNDQPLSPLAPVTVRLTESCRYILDWRRVD